MKILFAVSLLVAAAASVVYSQACHLRDFDLCMATGIFHYRNNGIPPDAEKLNEWCETMKEVGDCMGNFSVKCTSPLQKEVLGLLAGGGDDDEQLCMEGTEIRADYLKHSKCLADSAESGEFRTTLKDVQAMVEKLNDVQYKQRFPLLCCGFRRFHANADKLMNERCGGKAATVLTTVVHMITTDLPGTICQGYDPESDECQSLLPAKGTQLKGGENKSQLSKLFENMLGGN